MKWIRNLAKILPEETKKVLVDTFKELRERVLIEVFSKDAHI